jgi:hypothetical protein
MGLGDMKMKFKLLLFGLLLIPSLMFGQGYDRNRGRVVTEEEEGAITFQFDAFAFGVGSFFAEEGTTFSVDALFVPIQLHGVGIPFIKSGTSTGIAIEFHPATLTFGQGGNPQLNQLDYRLWSVSRVPLSAIPWSKLQSGTPSRMFAGTDLLINEGGPDDYTGGFDARFVIGGDLGIIWKGNMVIEIYSLQRDIPIAFALFWGF